MTHPSKPERLARSIIYESRWVNLYADRVRMPNGNIIAQHHLITFDHPAVLAVPFRAPDHYLMVKVYRYPTGTTAWEFPAGRFEPGEEIVEAARREVLEESGYASTDYELLYSYYPCGGISNQIFHVVRCRPTEIQRPFDADEIHAVQWFSEAEIREMILSRQMEDGYTLTAFLLHKLMPVVRSEQ